MAGNLTWDLSAQAASALEAGAKNQGSGWFVPNRPLPPLAPDDLGIARALDYEVGVNLQVRPKIADHIAGYDYPTLRNLSNACDYIKIAVQTVIDRMLRMRGHVVDDTDDNQDEADPSPKAKQINSWFKHPDGINSRGAWTAKILRDMLEIDAPTVYCDKEEGVARVLDGATIAARIGENGDICSYQQIIKGLPAHDYSLDEIIWKPKNVASYKIYGQSPVEQIAFTVEIALRRQAMQLGFFTDGNIPAALIEAPAHWNSVQIAKANRAWALMRKGASAKNQATFIPNGAKPYPLDRDPSKNEFDEWLMSIVAFAFSFAKTPFVKEVNRATAETSQDTAEREGHEAMCNWLSDFYNDVINSMYGPGYRWEWLTDEKPDGALIADLVKAGKLKTSALLRLGFKQTELGPDGPAPGAPGAGGANPFQKTQPNGEPAIPPTTTQPVKAPASKPPKAAKVPAVQNADVPIRNADVASDMEIVVQEYIDQLQAEAIAKGVKAYEAKITSVDVQDDPSFAIKVQPHIQAAATAGVAAGKIEKPSGIAEADLEDAALDYAQDRAAEMVGRKWIDGALVDNPDSTWSIAQTVRNSLRDIIADGLENKLTSEKIAQAIAADNESFSPGRSRMIARTEVAGAQEEGRLAYFRKAGIKQKQWSDQDGCPDCQANADQGPIDIDEEFQSGDQHAPAHPHCVCATIPVGDADVPEEDGDDDED